MRSHQFLANLLRIGFLSLFFASLATSFVQAEESTSSGITNSAETAESGPVSCTNTATGPLRRLVGVITDPTGAGIANAQLSLTCGDFHMDAMSAANGVYSFNVPAGNYRLFVEAANFGGASEDVKIANTETATELNVSLKVGQINSAVTVSAGNEYATTESSGGTKTDLPLSEVPQAISVVNRDLMNAQNVVKLDDALKNVAGVMPGGYYDGWDYYRIRGFDASFNTYIDGLRGGNGMSEEPWALESVEVLKGPSSALYGQSVLGGLVNIVTRKPVPDRFVHAQFTGGTFAFMDPAIDMGGSLNSSRTVYGRLAALYHTANSYVDYAYRHRYYFAPSLTWKPAPGTSLTLIGRIQRDNGRNGMPLPAWGTALPNINGPLSIHTYNGELEAHANQLAQANQQFGYQLRHTINEHLSLRQNARFAWYQQNWNRIYYPSFLGADQRTLYRYPLNWNGTWENHEVDTSVEGRANFWKMEHSTLLASRFLPQPQYRAWLFHRFLRHVAVRAARSLQTGLWRQSCAPVAALHLEQYSDAVHRHLPAGSRPTATALYRHRWWPHRFRQERKQGYAEPELNRSYAAHRCHLAGHSIHDALCQLQQVVYATVGHGL
ncbi:TonB-dependent receptor plug domain-containing protein [Edaphobacter sp. 4G125]|nr:TonB-dependent receptor plug domain-containing protein [Edaphobacter sp. 4G125]